MSQNASARMTSDLVFIMSSTVGKTTFLNSSILDSLKISLLYSISLFQICKTRRSRRFLCCLTRFANAVFGHSNKCENRITCDVNSDNTIMRYIICRVNVDKKHCIEGRTEKEKRWNVILLHAIR